MWGTSTISKVMISSYDTGLANQNPHPIPDHIAVIQISISSLGSTPCPSGLFHIEYFPRKAIRLISFCPGPFWLNNPASPLPQIISSELQDLDYCNLPVYQAAKLIPVHLLRRVIFAGFTGRFPARRADIALSQRFS